MKFKCQDPEEERGISLSEAGTPVAPDNPFDDAGPEVEVDFEPEVAFETSLQDEPTTAASQRLGNDVAYESGPPIAYEPTPTVSYEPSSSVSFEPPPSSTAAAPMHVREREQPPSFYEASPAVQSLASRSLPQNGVPAEPLYETSAESSRVALPPLNAADTVTVATSGRASSDGQPLSARIEHDVISPSSSRR